MSIRIVRAVLHAGALSYMVWGYNNLSTLIIDSTIRQEKGGHLQFLTIQGLAIASITMGLSLLSDAFPSSTLLVTLKRGCLIIALPLSVVVSSIYWTLLLIFAPLILRASPPSEPSSSTEAPQLMRIPLTMDLALHATPAIAILTDFFLVERKFTGRASSVAAPLVTLFYSLCYAIWIEYCASYNKHFPYPFLDVNLPARLAIYAGTTMLGLGSFRLLNYLRS